jgi:hypothetical protein
MERLIIFAVVDAVLFAMIVWRVALYILRRRGKGQGDV